MEKSKITPELQERINFAREKQRQLREELKEKFGNYNEVVNASLVTSTSSVDVMASSSLEDEAVRCPRCRSTQITANKKGYGLGKGVAGGLLLGPVGLLGGFIGSKKVMITCLKCGHQWKP